MQESLLEALELATSWILLFATATVCGLAAMSSTRKLAGVNTEDGKTKITSTSKTSAALVGSLLGVVATVYLISQDFNFWLAVLGGVAVGAVSGVIARILGRWAAGGYAVAAGLAACLGWLAFVVFEPKTLGPILLAATLAVAGAAMLAGFRLGQKNLDYVGYAVFAMVTVAMVDILQAFDRMERALGSTDVDNIFTTLWSVVLAVGASTLLFVWSNMLVDQAGKDWRKFSTAVGGLLGFVVFGLLDGNRLLQVPGTADVRLSVADGLHGAVNDQPLSLIFSCIVLGTVLFGAVGYAFGVSRDQRSRGLVFGLGAGAGIGLIWGVVAADRIPVDTTIKMLWTPLLGAAMSAVVGFVVGSVKQQPLRAGAGLISGSLLGLALGSIIAAEAQPQFDTAWLLLAPAFAALGAANALVRGRHLLSSISMAAFLGWALGSFGFAELGSGSVAETYLATGVAGALLGLRFGVRPYPDLVDRRRFEGKSRVPIFLAPALSFVVAGLVIPLIVTVWLSLVDAAGSFTIGNYQTIFQDPGSFDWSNRLSFFGSVLTWFGAFLVVLAVVWGLLQGFRSGEGLASAKPMRLAAGASLITIALLEYVWIRQATEDVAGADGSNLVSNVLTWLLVIGLMIFGSVLAKFIKIPFIARGGLFAGLAVLAGAIVVDAFSGPESAGFSTAGRLTLVGLLAFGLLFLIAPIGSAIGKATGNRLAVDLAGPQAAPFAIGLTFLAISGFAVIRGSIFNSFWWVFVVTIGATAFGLAFAVLADRAKMENAAKSLVFMPMAISFVGAGIIWKFMLVGRNEGDDQTGLLNFLWVGLGQVSTASSGSNYTWRIVWTVFLVAFIGLMISVTARAFMKARPGMALSGISGALLSIYLVWGMTVGSGLGGYGNEAGRGTVIEFLNKNQPFNNLWLMLVLVWIQTGFAMVIFSAAIKAVPSELTEAAKVDGATDNQVLWRITIPQISPTMGVVITTLIVLVMKVFDIVKVMTGGNFGTEIIANDMFTRAFEQSNSNLGSALAVILFLAVVPVMYFNIRRMDESAA